MHVHEAAVFFFLSHDQRTQTVDSALSIPSHIIMNNVYLMILCDSTGVLLRHKHKHP